MRLRIATLAIVLVVAAGACEWPQWRFDAANTGHNPFEREIAAANVGSLVPSFSVDAQTTGMPAAVVGAGHLFTGSTYAGGPASTGRAFDAAGIEGCGGAPTVCAAQWTFGIGSPRVVGATVFTDYVPTDGRALGYDARGLERCGGVPKVCAPRTLDVPDDVWDPAVDVARLRFRWRTVSGNHTVTWVLDGYDALDELACGEDPGGQGHGCFAVWSTTSPATYPGAVVGGPAVGSGSVFYTASQPSDSLLVAADGDGATRWTANLGNGAGLPPIVVDGRVLAWGVVGGAPRWLAFDATGTRGCAGVPRVCTPLWVTEGAEAGALDAAAALAGGTLFRVVGDRLEAYASAGCGAAVCAPKWSAMIGGTNASAPAVANGVVYAATDTGRIKAFDAHGVKGCQGEPRVCTPLWSTKIAAAAGSPIVVDGRVYVPSADGTVTAFSLPG
jgi:outer membrane protein assembly factor BamB